jgi:aminopeptidase N
MIPIFMIPIFNRLFQALVLALLLAATAARADGPFAFDSTPGRLPKTVVPIHYALDLRPNLSAHWVRGTAVIEIEVREPTEKLVLNARDMTFASVALDGVPAKSTSVDEDEQTVTFTLTRAIEAARHTLRISYSTAINKSGHGIYSIEYRTDGARKRMIASHSEPSDARRIFPGWDEPAFKATFELTVTVPQTFLAVSNTPIAREETMRGGRKRVSFERTPKMSTYLFLFVAGELERTTREADGVTIGVVARPGRSASARYALDEAAAMPKYYNEYFGERYPLPKLDLIALPRRAASAMEHWGAITLFENRVLYDPATDSIETKWRIFSLLAHEMAHQWFGNLVTLAWWNDLWLNEGFATWMQYKVEQVLHPEWQPWLRADSGKQAAMARDVRRNPRALRGKVENESEAREAFDTITYSKGQSVVRMAESYLGEDVFRDAMRSYIKEHAYGNATAADLWRALDAASGKPVGSVLSAYAEQPGVPLVVADTRWVQGEQKIALKQDRFTVRESEAKPQRWQVPIVFGPPGGATATVLLDGTTELAAGRCGDAIKLNRGDVGYYRVRYDAEMEGALAHHLSAMTPADRVNLLVDAWATAETLRSPPSAYLELADQLGGDDHYLVAGQVIATLTRVDKLARGRPGRAAFEEHARGILRPIFARVGWEATIGEAGERAALRSRLVVALGSLGDDAVMAEAKRRFDAFLQKPESLPRALRYPVLQLVGRTADRATYETLIKLARKSEGHEERALYYGALASARDPALARETLALTDELADDLARRVISWVAARGEQPELAVEFAKRHFEKLADKGGSSFREAFISLMANFSNPARADELKDFQPVHENSDDRRLAERTREQILANADFVAQQMPAIDEWVRRHPLTP